MNTHEYQAKEVLRSYGIPIPDFGVAHKVQEVEKIISTLKLKEAVVKIQVHAGGRGKAGGVKLAKTPEEIVKVAGQLLGLKMVNNQTGPDGVVAHQVLISKAVDIEKEFYLAVVLDRAKAEPVLIASPEGGVEIEEVAAKNPEQVLSLPVGFDGHLKGYQLVRLAKFMGWDGEQAKVGKQIASALVRLFLEKDASLLEINPLVRDKKGKIWALDAKLSIDDNALFRQPEMAGFFDPTQLSKSEVAARHHELSYIALDGNVGCMVNGAGLAMATMDLIQFAGGKPANFLDVGGGASKEKIAAGFQIILSDPRVKAVLVNIFGGIMNCATVAEGILEGAAQTAVKIPLVVRMEGTNVEEGKKLLQQSKLPITPVDSLAEATDKVVELTRKQ
jgi:succinyl-CoA synthetase beta subunit